MIDYRVNPNFVINCGFQVNGEQIKEGIIQTNTLLSDLPSTLYKSIDYKTTSAVIGALFCDTLGILIPGCLVNPIEKGHPDIIPSCGKDCSEEELRNYPEGLEVKTTVGNIKQGANLRAGQTRVDQLTGITWQAHHREVAELLGLVWDFVSDEHEFSFPKITASFYTDELIPDDWGVISGTTGRNTKVTGMKTSGKRKMAQGWIALIERKDYLLRYSALLKIEDLS